MPELGWGDLAHRPDRVRCRGCGVVRPVAFPASFRFEQVPNLGWSLDAFIDVDGGFPPIWSQVRSLAR
jgi:hypothetical protein